MLEQHTARVSTATNTVNARRDGIEQSIILGQYTVKRNDRRVCSVETEIVGISPNILGTLQRSENPALNLGSLTLTRFSFLRAHGEHAHLRSLRNPP